MVAMEVIMGHQDTLVVNVVVTVAADVNPFLGDLKLLEVSHFAITVLPVVRVKF
jgi:hypothetical protein